MEPADSVSKEQFAFIDAELMSARMFVIREFISLYEAVSQDVGLTSEGKRIHVLMLSHVISFHLFFWVTTAQNLRPAEQLTDFLASEYV